MNRTALNELKAKVEAGTLHKEPHRGMPLLTQFHYGEAKIDGWGDGKAMSAYFGSLDAARALHDAVLPGWSWEVCMRPFGVRPHRCHFLLTTDHTGWGNGQTVTASSDIPARAWLLAILSALIAQEERGDGQG